MFIARNGKTEVDEEDADADGAGGVAAVSPYPLPRTSGTGGQMLMNTGEKGAVVAMMETLTGADNPLEVIVSRGEVGGDVVDMARTPTTIMDDPLLTTGQTHSPHLRHNTPRTRHHPSLLPRRTHSLLHPLLGPLCMGLL